MCKCKCILTQFVSTKIKSVSVSVMNSNLRLLGIRCVSVIKWHVRRAWRVCTHSCCKFAHKLIDSSLSCFQRCSCRPSFSCEISAQWVPNPSFFLSNIMPLSQSDVKDIRVLNLPHVLSRGSSHPVKRVIVSHSEYQITSLPLFLDVIKWVTIHSNAEIPFRSYLARVIFVSCALASVISASCFDISYEIRALWVPNPSFSWESGALWVRNPGFPCETNALWVPAIVSLGNQCTVSPSFSLGK